MLSRRPRLPSNPALQIGGVVVGLLLAVALVIYSPLALSRLTHLRHDWSQLSNVGQTYGAVSALISSLALGGVVVSLLYQARDSVTAREQAIRTWHLSLLKMEMDDPSLLNATGAPWGLPMSSEIQPIREFLFVQMWVSYWWTSYAIGGTSEGLLRSLASRELFHSAAGRNYWKMAGKLQLANSDGRRYRFYRILDEEYRKALISNAPIADPIVVGSSNSKPSIVAAIGNERIPRAALIAISAAIGGFIGWSYKRKGR